MGQQHAYLMLKCGHGQKYGSSIMNPVTHVCGVCEEIKAAKTQEEQRFLNTPIRFWDDVFKTVRTAQFNYNDKAASGWECKAGDELERILIKFHDNSVEMARRSTQTRSLRYSPDYDTTGVDWLAE